MCFGGPVWHASARTATYDTSVALALRALKGIGDEAAGQWIERGNNGVAHIRRRLTPSEVARSRCVLRDIRGTMEEADRLAKLLRDAPHLAPYVGAR